MKITGAHDFNAYAVAKRGGIPCYRLMDSRAAMRDDGAPSAEERDRAFDRLREHPAGCAARHAARPFGRGVSAEQGELWRMH